LQRSRTDREPSKDFCSHQPASGYTSLIFGPGRIQGAVAGEPWCAYFVSWAAAQAGAPLGENGEGLGSVAQITDWARRAGKLLPAGTTPRPGDLILFGTHHVGIVESVAADGTITTVEGNTGDAVRRRQRAPSEATGFVRL